MIYLLLIIYILFLIKKYDTKSHFDKSHYRILLVLFILMSGLSYRLGIDTVRYENTFDTAFNTSFDWNSIFSYEGSWSNEPLWVLLNWLVYNTVGEFWVLKLIVSCFVNITIFWFIRKHSDTPFTCVLLYFILGTFFQLNYQVLREAVAVSFFLIAFDKLISGKVGLIKYFIFLLPAILFHRFALVSFLFPLFVNFRYGKRYYISVLIVFLITPVFSYLMDSFLNIQFLNLVLGESISGYKESIMYGITTRNIFGYITIALFSVIPLVLLLNNSKRDQIQSLSLLYIIVLILRMSSLVILYRINNYLALPFIISFASSISNSCYKKSFALSRISLMNSITPFVICLIIYMGTSIRQMVTSDEFVMYYPYSSIIDKSMDPDRESFYRGNGIDYWF